MGILLQRRVEAHVAIVGQKGNVCSYNNSAAPKPLKASRSEIR